jgi:hypothetical protein
MQLPSFLSLQPAPQLPKQLSTSFPFGPGTQVYPSWYQE